MNPAPNNFKKIYRQLDRLGLDSLLITLPANITYLSGYLSRDSLLLISKKATFYITDPRYSEEAKKFLPGFFKIKRTKGTLLETIKELSKTLKIRKLGFEGKYLSVSQYSKLKKTVLATTELILTQNLIEELRQVKAAPEQEKIRQATKITIKALQYAKKIISPGIREIELAGELERFIRYLGAQRASFEIIIASGPNSSYPHHISGSRKIQNNEPVLIDIGADYSGYKSDLTRVFFLGKINTLAQNIYRIVSAAQEKAIKKVKPGVLINKVDAEARQYITRKGYGGFFGHSTGHGLGLEIHESPSISPKETGELKEGMIFTVEPGIYLPGKFGIRIEDTVLVTKKGVEVISGTLDK